MSEIGLTGPGRSGQDVKDEGARLTVHVRWRTRAAPVDAQGEAGAEGHHGRDGEEQQDQSHASAMRVHVFSILGLTPPTQTASGHDEPDRAA